MTTSTRQLDAHDKRRVAVEALCDHRSVANYLDGKPVRTMLRMRIEAALRKLGFGEAVRSEAAAS